MSHCSVRQKDRIPYTFQIKEEPPNNFSDVENYFQSLISFDEINSGLFRKKNEKAQEKGKKDDPFVDGKSRF